jgi:polyferredoxin
LSAARKTDKNCGDCGTCIEISPVINFTVSRRPTLQENSPTKVGARVLRHQLWIEVCSKDDLFCADGSQ